MILPFVVVQSNVEDKCSCCFNIIFKGTEYIMFHTQDCYDVRVCPKCAKKMNNELLSS